MICCVFQATNLVNNFGQRKSARTFVSRQEASNKLYTVLPTVIFIFYLLTIFKNSDYNFPQVFNFANLLNSTRVFFTFSSVFRNIYIFRFIFNSHYAYKPFKFKKGNDIPIIKTNKIIISYFLFADSESP
jgi:hypothetical protein